MASKAKKEAKRLEKLKAEAELWKKTKRDELQREMTFQSRNRDRVDKKWRELMLKIKEPLYRKDIQVMWHTFERAFDKKDHVIAYTIRLMEIAEDQFGRTIASFCDTIDNTILKFLKEMEETSQYNDRRTAELLKMGEDETDEIVHYDDSAETHMQLLLYHAHKKADTLAWTTRGEFLVKEDEEQTKYASERENLRSFLENNYSNIWDQYKAVLKGYILTTAENQKEVRKLRRKENIMSDIIASQAKRIANSDDMLKRLRTELQAYESGTNQAVFRDRRDRHRAACFALKRTLSTGCELDAKQLRTLVRSADGATEWLESAYRKGEKILRIAALCRKYESQREKVLPFGSEIPDPPTQSNGRRHQSDDSLVVNAITNSSGMTRLWQRIAKVELTRRALFREKMILEAENEAILRSIKEFKERSANPDSTKCICTKQLSNETFPNREE